MKRTLITFLLIIGITVVYAQNGKVNSALNYVTSGQLDKAKEAIDAAEVHEKTKDTGKMFYAKGRVLQAIGESQDENYKNLYEDPIPLAYNYYQEALKRDEKGRLEKLINLALPMLLNDFINLGILNFQESNFEGSLAAFESSLEIGQLEFFGGGADTVIIFNAGLAAYNGKIYDKAVEYFTRAKDLDYGDFTLVILIKNSYIELGDSTMALKVLQEGFEEYPDNESMLIELINYYLSLKEQDAPQKALDYIGLAKEKDPDNASYFHAEGIMYDKLGEIEKSIKSYEQALVFNPDYFDSNYNLGAHHFNRGVNKVEECNEIIDNTEYAKCKEVADAIFIIALPYMEKAHEINPEDISTMETLKLLYYRMKMMDKHDEIDKKLKGEM